MSEEETKQIGYPIEPADPDRITTISIDSSNAANYTKQEGVDWHIFYTHEGKMVDSHTLERV